MLKALFSIAFGLTFGAVLLFVGLLASSAFAAPPQVSVNCDMGSPTALQDGIDLAREGAMVNVTGDCSGASVVVATDGLTLFGNGSATITGDDTAPAITIAGAHNVTVESFALIDGGDANGIVVRATASALILDITLITGADGLVVVHGAFVEFDNSNVVGAADDGIVAFQNATIVIRDADISGNFDDGVVVSRSSVVQINGVTTINNNGGRGVTLSGGRVQFRGDNTVQDNGQEDLGCFGFSRFIVNNAITSSTKNVITRNCEVAELSGSTLFVDHPFNLVDCAAGDTIAEALADGLTDITVRGLCDEHLVITTSNVTITGENLDGGGNPVDGIFTDLGPGPVGSTAVLIRGAQNVFLTNLKLTGGRNNVSVFAGSAAFITNSDLTPSPAGAGGRFGLFVGDNSWVQMRDSSVSAGSGAGILAVRNGTLRLFNSDVSGGGTGTTALNLQNSVAFFFGVNVTGRLSARLNSRLAFFTEFLGVPYPNSVIDSSIGPILCSRYSNITAFPAGIVEDTSAVAFTNADIIAFDDCRATIE